ncbi:MAG: Ig-like domain-containing protein [Firmicutes bacterium]|nr:Ig-like domain-containing protein [Bacillota bacterium]
MFSKTHNLKKWVAFMIVAMVLLATPKNVKAATVIAGGDSEENAVAITPGVDYISTSMNSYYKVTLPANTYCVGIAYDEYSEAYLNVDSWYLGHGGSIGDSSYAHNEIYYAKDGVPSAYLAEGQEVIFGVETTKADNCRFKVVVGTLYSRKNAPTIELNKSYSVSVPCSCNGSYGLDSHYKFVAPYSGTYKVSAQYTTTDSQEIYIRYKDGIAVSTSYWAKQSKNKGYATFDVTQGMTYYVDIPLDEPGDITFSVSNQRVSSIALNTTQLSMKKNEQFLLEATALPEDAVNREVSFSSSNPEVASVSEEGWITAVKAGTAVITAAAKDGSGVTASCTVTVNPIAVQKITLDCNNLTYDYWEVYDEYSEYGDEDLQINVTGMEPSDAENKDVVFSSSNPAVAEVNSEGYLTLKNAGTTVITCSAADGFGASATCTVTVIKELGKGEKFTSGDLKYKVTSYPSDTEKTVSVYGVSNKKLSKYTIPSNVSVNGKTYKVTEVASKAFYNCKKAKTIQIGSNVKKIGKKAFGNCKALKKLEVKSKKISSVAKDSFSGINKKAQIKVPASKLKKYRTLFAKKGQRSSVKIKK